MRYPAKHHTRLLISALIFTLSACGNTPSGEDDSPPEDLRAEVFDLMIEGLCGAAWDCPEYNPQLIEQLSRYGSEAECVAGVRTIFDADNSADLDAAISAGRVVVSSSRATQCLQETRALLAQAKCQGIILEVFSDDLPESCQEAFEGTVAAGGACTSGVECAGELSCEIEGDTCYGVCSAERCGDTVCAAGELCVADASGESCQPTRALGESCGAQSPCELELSCYYEGEAGTAAEGVCIAQGSLDAGALCDVSEQCGEGFWCDQNLCVQNPPQPQPQPQPAGSPCDYRDDCVADLLCTDGVCAAPVASPLGAEGDACGPLPQRPCGLGLACQSLDLETFEGTCAPHATQGAPCHYSAQCIGGLSCTSSRDDQGVLSPGTCEPPRPIGQPCDEAEDCTTRQCEQGLCAAAPAACVVP